MGLIPFSGCTTVTEDLGDPLPETGQLSIGTTTQEVLETLGPPSRISSIGDGYAFLYEHNVVTEEQIGFSFNYLWLKYLKFAIGSAEADREILMLIFDQNRQLSRKGYREWTEDFGGGKSLQLIVSLMPLVDKGEISDTPASMIWGGAMLETNMFESLNSPHSPRFGVNAIELSGTPSGAGQRTLEAKGLPD